jgi:hypothetical protein
MGERLVRGRGRLSVQAPGSFVVARLQGHACVNMVRDPSRATVSFKNSHLTDLDDPLRRAADHVGVWPRRQTAERGRPALAPRNNAAFRNRGKGK